MDLIFTRTNRSGFTLIELLVVITVIGILAAITLNIAAGANQKVAMDKARAEIAAISNALEQYKNVNDEYPATLDFSLIGPFYTSRQNLLDPYGSTYQYIFPGIQNPASFDLWSNGKSSFDTNDDIGNW